MRLCCGFIQSQSQPRQPQSFDLFYTCQIHYHMCCKVISNSTSFPQRDENKSWPKCSETLWMEVATGVAYYFAAIAVRSNVAGVSVCLSVCSHLKYHISELQYLLTVAVTWPSCAVYLWFCGLPVDFWHHWSRMSQTTLCLLHSPGVSTVWRPWLPSSICGWQAELCCLLLTRALPKHLREMRVGV